MLLVSLTFWLLSFSSFGDDDVVVVSFASLRTKLIVSAVDVLGCFRDFEAPFVEFLILPVVLVEEDAVIADDDENDRFLLLDTEVLPFVDDDEDEVDPDAEDDAAERAVTATDLDRTELKLLAARVTTIIQLQEELVA